MSEVKSKTVQGPAGEFEVALYHSQNKNLSRRWVFSIVGPENKTCQGFARTRSSAERKIRRWIAKHEAQIVRLQERQRAYREIAEMLESSGVDTWKISRMEDLPGLGWKLIRPGEIICSYRTNRRWQAVLFLDGKEVASESARTRFWAERHARRQLQRIYRHEALQALGPEHAPD